MDCNTTSRQTLGYSKYEQDAEGIQNMFKVYLIVLVFIKWKQVNFYPLLV